MKINRTLGVLLALLILAACGASFSVSAQSQKQVRVYFPNTAGSKSTKSNPMNLQPVMRSVDAASPLRPTIEELLKGPTADEEQKGFMALDTTGMEIVRLGIKKGTARASFVRKPEPAWAGDLSPDAFRDAVRRTLKQFKGVKRTIICVDGLLNFGALGEDVKDRKCPK